jgi:hypothetical protein
MTESLVNQKDAKNHNQRTIFIRCGCQSEMLVLDYDGEVDMIDLSMYEIDVSYKYRMSLWQKIRYIYQVIRYGQPYTDQIVLNRDQINELKSFLETI